MHSSHVMHVCMYCLQWQCTTGKATNLVNLSSVTAGNTVSAYCTWSRMHSITIFMTRLNKQAVEIYGYKQFTKATHGNRKRHASTVVLWCIMDVDA